tara:strand:+ start:5244 stop:6026 length:783 start_codon:yes stop_codon:yes gene_type:complete
MGFKVDGSSHRNGIKNEKQQIKYLLSGAAHKVVDCLTDNFQVIHKGGTQYKEDFQIIDGDKIIRTSAKRKKSLKLGSYDYVNSASVIAEIPTLKNLSYFVRGLRENKESLEKEEVREKFNKESNRLLKKLTPEEVSIVLRSHVAEKNKDIFMMVTDESSGFNYWWEFKKSQFYKDVMNDDLTARLKFGSGQTSAKIIFEDNNGVIIDHNIRIRLVLNNGIGALLGLSKSNKFSTPTIKIQQDRCDKMIERLQKENIIIVF